MRAKHHKEEIFSFSDKKGYYPQGRHTRGECMKKLIFSCGLVMATLLVAAPNSQAAPIVYNNFCPGNPSCPEGVTEASLLFSTWDATADPNDYSLQVTFSGVNAPAYVKQFDVTIVGASTPDGYEAKPTLLSFPGGTDWDVYYDKIAANPASCGSDTFQGNAFCAKASDFGAPLGTGTASFMFYVDLMNLVLSDTTDFNLRAQFLTSRGDNAGILSPDNRNVPAPVTPVPEPTTMTMLGLGLLGGVARSVQKKRKTKKVA